MRIFKREIADEMVNLLQRISFELEGQKRIIKELILENENNPTFIDNETFKKYNVRYEEKNAEYELMKQEFQDKFVPKRLLEKDRAILTNWELDYNTSMMTITYKGNDLDDYTDTQVEELFAEANNKGACGNDDCCCDGNCDCTENKKE